MRTGVLLLSTFVLAAPLAAQQAVAQATLPATLQADRATIQQDQALMKSVVTQLKSDEAAGDTAAVAADRTALRLAHIKVGQDFGKLHADAQSILQPDVAALTSALTQLHTDQVANNTGAIPTDQAAAAAAEKQIMTDREAIFAGLGHGFGGGHGHHHHG
jgi:hypothetical protein